MKELKYNKEIIGYAVAFVSFILPKVEVKEIILFGSTARGEADNNSDIDLFFDVNESGEGRTKEIVKEELNKFYKSQIAESWALRGIKNSISVKVGRINDWKLHGSIISEGITLYGKYKEIPKDMQSFVFFQIEPIKNIAKRNKVIRKLFGRKEKGYLSEGLVNEFNGKKYSSSSFVVDKEHTGKIISMLRNEKVSYRFFEYWGS